MGNFVRIASQAACAAGVLLFASAACAAGPAPAEAPPIVQKNDCLKCHEIDQDKDGPSFRKIAAKYKGMPDAERKLIARMAHGEKARFPDGHEETHKPVNTSPPKDMAQIKSLVQWILAQ
jgi:cytochrome c